MKLPNAHLAEAEQEKICGYLLNAAHPDNGGKAAFFAGLGFQAENWRALATALRELAVSCPAAKSLASAHGAKYIVDGRIRTPGGRMLWVRTVWIGAQRRRVW
jgi:hypothetical protein